MITGASLFTDCGTLLFTDYTYTLPLPYYNSDDDYFVCSMGQHMTYIRKRHRKVKMDILENIVDIWHKTVPDVLSRVCVQKQMGTEYTK